jgi:glycosyltransferase involved in cell wall biosynthesis
MEEYINSRYESTAFINGPKSEDGSKIQVLFENRKNNENDILFSIVMPIHNQEKIILDNVTSVLNNTTEKSYELILILDSCSDNSESILLNYFSLYNFSENKLLCKLLILKSEIPLFETSADNLGFYCSSGKYCLEIQADMKMTELGYNMKLLIPFLKDENIIGISGRCCHGFTNHWGVGKLGRGVEKKIEENGNIDKTCYYIHETCPRGPLLLEREKLKELGYLDEVNYFLDNSDHDLFMRANVLKNWSCGYVPIEFESNLEHGSTRKPRNELNQRYYELKRESTKNGENGFIIQNEHKFYNTSSIKIFSL